MGEPEVKGGQVVKFEAPKPRFMDRFRAHTPPENVPVKTRARVRGLVGAPLVFLNDVCRLTEGRATLVVALFVFRPHVLCRDPAGALAGGGLTRGGDPGEREARGTGEARPRGVYPPQKGRREANGQGYFALASGLKRDRHC